MGERVATCVAMRILQLSGECGAKEKPSASHLKRDPLVEPILVMGDATLKTSSSAAHSIMFTAL